MLYVLENEAGWAGLGRVPFFIKGILNQALDEKANLVNAASIASSRGLRIHESHKPRASSGGAGDVLSVLLKTSREEHLVK